MVGIGSSSSLSAAGVAYVKKDDEVAIEGGPRDDEWPLDVKASPLLPPSGSRVEL